MEAITLQLNARRDVNASTKKGAKFFIGTSPYDFPVDLQCTYDDSEGALQIAFRYITGAIEVGEKVHADDVIQVFAGPSGNRLSLIKISVDKHNLDHVEMNVFTDALSSKLRKPEGSSRTFRSHPRLEVPTSVLDAVGESLISNQDRIKQLIPTI